MERKDAGKEDKKKWDFAFEVWGVWPKELCIWSQNAIKNSSSNKSNLKSFILYRVERIRDWFLEI